MTERYLRDFHNRRPGATSLCFGASATRCAGRTYASPYACLTETVPQTERPMNVLDLACGDGYLLAQLASCRALMDCGS